MLKHIFPIGQHCKIQSEVSDLLKKSRSVRSSSIMYRVHALSGHTHYEGKNHMIIMHDALPDCSGTQTDLQYV